MPILRILCYNGSLVTWKLSFASFVLAIQHRHGPHRERRFQQCFNCCARIHCRYTCLFNRYHETGNVPATMSQYVYDPLTGVPIITCFCFGFTSYFVIYTMEYPHVCTSVIGPHPSSLVTLTVSLSLFPVAPTLKHRASMKLFVSLQFINPKTVGRTPWKGDQPIAMLQPTQTQSKYR
jgi:hypothetical protein